MRFLLAATSLVAMAWLAGCSSPSPSDNDTGTPPTEFDRPRVGEAYDVYLESDIDGETIAFTVIEPPLVYQTETAPLILHSHGYSGSRARDASSGLLEALHNEGFGFISLDERGNGESGGTVRILDPAFEGQDWLQVLDWAEENLAWLRYEDADKQEVEKTVVGANPVMGAVGGSYGGGFQHLIYALDEKHRLDAIAPDITWNNLLYSLFPNGVFKSQWATLLATAGSVPPNTQDQEVQEGLIQGLTLNSLDAEKQALLYKNSLASHCAGENSFTAADGLQPIDAFYTQSAMDTLFNFTDAYRNYECISALGGDVRMYVKSSGHGLDNGDGSDICGGLGRTEATVAWYREKLLHQPGAADRVLDICLQLSGTSGDSVAPETIAVGGSEVEFGPVSVTTGSVSGATATDVTDLIDDFSGGSLGGLTDITNGVISGLNDLSGGTVSQQIVLLYDAAADGDNVLAGVPTLDIMIDEAVVPAVDPIIFVGFGVRNGDNGLVDIIQNQMTPFRGYQMTEDSQLVGVFERLTGDEQLVLVMQGDFSPQYLTSASALPGTVQVSGTVKLPLLGDLASIESP